jgi:hypothetical protein
MRHSGIYKIEDAAGGIRLHKISPALRYLLFARRNGISGIRGRGVVLGRRIRHR